MLEDSEIDRLVDSMPYPYFPIAEVQDFNCWIFKTIDLDKLNMASVDTVLTEAVDASTIEGVDDV